MIKAKPKFTPTASRTKRKKTCLSFSRPIRYTALVCPVFCARLQQDKIVRMVRIKFGQNFSLAGLHMELRQSQQALPCFGDERRPVDGDFLDDAERRQRNVETCSVGGPRKSSSCDHGSAVIQRQFVFSKERTRHPLNKYFRLWSFNSPN